MHVFPSFLNIGPNIHERLPFGTPEKVFDKSAGSILMVVSPVGRILPKVYADSLSDILVSSPASLAGNKNFA